jgi:hypothetical protein
MIIYGKKIAVGYGHGANCNKKERLAPWKKN